MSADHRGQRAALPRGNPILTLSILAARSATGATVWRSFGISARDEGHPGLTVVRTVAGTEDERDFSSRSAGPNSSIGRERRTIDGTNAIFLGPQRDFDGVFLGNGTPSIDSGVNGCLINCNKETFSVANGTHFGEPACSSGVDL